MHHLHLNLWECILQSTDLANAVDNTRKIVRLIGLCEADTCRVCQRWMGRQINQLQCIAGTQIGGYLTICAGAFENWCPWLSTAGGTMYDYSCLMEIVWSEAMRNGCSWGTSNSTITDYGFLENTRKFQNSIFLRDHRSKLADLCSDIWPIYFPVIDHKRNWEISLYLLCDLADITGDYSKFDYIKQSQIYVSISQHSTVKLSRYHLCISFKCRARL